MSIIAKNDSKPRELIPAGNYIARCYQMIEIGTIPNTWKGQEKMTPKVRIGWELPLELKVFDPAKGEQPLVISKEYTQNMGEKANLRKDLESWLGKAFTADEAKAFDVTNLMGKACMINIIHEAAKNDPTKIYANISSVTPVPKGFTVPAQINPTFELSYDAWDETKFNSLPDFIREKMMGSDEYKAMITPQALVNDQPNIVIDKTGVVTADDLPF